MEDEYMSDNTQAHLEPRVARLEVGLETLTKNVSDLTITIRDNNLEVSRQLAALQVSVTTAAGPKRTDWGVILTAIGLILAIGAAVFVPINNSTKDNKDAILQVQTTMSDHTKMTLHPVGQALVQRLEEQILTHTLLNDKAMKEHAEHDTREFEALDKKLQLEYSLVNVNLAAQIAALDVRLQKEFGLTQLRNDARFNKLEADNVSQRDLDQQELRQWRSKANGLSIPTAVVPLIPTQLPVTPLLK